LLAVMVGDADAAPEARAAAAEELRAGALASADVGPLLRHSVVPLVALLSDGSAPAEARAAAAGALQCYAVDGAAERAIVAAGAVGPLVTLCADTAGSGAAHRARAARALQNLAGPALAGQELLSASEAVEALARCSDARAAEAGASAMAALCGRGVAVSPPRHVLPALWDRSVEFTQRLLSPADLRKPARAVSRALHVPRPTSGVEIRVLEVGPCSGARGLFAARDFVPGERVMRYCGVAKARGPAGSGDASDYLYALGGAAVDIDAARAGNESRYANDCRGTGKARNAQFVEAWGAADGRPVDDTAADSLSLAVWIEALRPIAAGDEILVSYGANYPLL